MRGRSHVDMVVVGAGAAGLGATRTARELGLDVLTLEAMDRIGGRAFTDSRPFGFPWDAGCHWLHSASINPFTRFADESGFHYRTTSVRWTSWIDGAPTTAQEEDAVDAFINATLEATTRCGQEGIDIPVADLVDPDSPWLDIFRCQINAEWGVDPRAASTLDLARYRDTGENWPIEEGYGALVARVAGDAVSNVRLDTVVESIDWSGSGGSRHDGRGYGRSCRRRRHRLDRGAQRRGDRSDLARPLADRLFFAGEATSPECFRTCHGAWETGVAGARVVARQRKRTGAASE